MPPPRQRGQQERGGKVGDLSTSCRGGTAGVWLRPPDPEAPGMLATCIGTLPCRRCDTEPSVRLPVGLMRAVARSCVSGALRSAPGRGLGLHA